MKLELKDSEYKFISKLVYEKAGINLHDGKRELIKSRLSKRLRELGLQDFRQYVKVLKDDPSGLELVVLLDRLSTNKTDFFREPNHFIFLQNKGLSNISLRKQASRDRKLRVWSAGCSSGEEPYTIGIVLSEFFGNEHEWNIKILATDISTRILKTAKTGVYPPSVLEPVSRNLRLKYFSKMAGPNEEYRVSDYLKKLVTYGRLNLMEKWPMSGPFDLIFCRNVMIYFDKETQATLISRFYNLLAPGGYFFLGHAESLSNSQSGFKHIQPSVYQKPLARVKDAKWHR